MDEYIINHLRLKIQRIKKFSTTEKQWLILATFINK